jgi:hypothetical protein
MQNKSTKQYKQNRLKHGEQVVFIAVHYYLNDLR